MYAVDFYAGSIGEWGQQLERHQDLEYSFARTRGSTAWVASWVADAEVRRNSTIYYVLLHVGRAPRLGQLENLHMEAFFELYSYYYHS